MDEPETSAAVVADGMGSDCGEGGSDDDDNPIGLGLGVVQFTTSNGSLDGKRHH